MTNSVDPDEMAHCVPSHADHTVCIGKCIIWSIIINTMSNGVESDKMARCAPPYLELHCLHR